SFSFNDRCPTDIYPLSLHDALPISAARLRRPSVTIAWASTVAVVVPSPATSLVFVAACLSIWAPMFWKWFSSSISLATVTPSWRSEEHTSELQSRGHLVCRLLLEKK